MSETVDFDLFNTLVWEIVRQVPQGQVTTYGQIASMIPCPVGADPAEYPRLAARWVGSAMNAVSGRDDPTIPWHRVINGKGGISLSPEGQAGREQRRRLRAEGVQFDAQERVNFRVVGWLGPEPAWLEKMNLLPPRPLVEDKSPPPDEDKPHQLSLF